MLVLSLVGWVALCTWVWMLLGATAGQPLPEAVAENARVVADADSTTQGNEVDSARELPVLDAQPDSDASQAPRPNEQSLDEQSSEAEPDQTSSPAQESDSESPLAEQVLPSARLPETEPLEVSRLPVVAEVENSTVAESPGAGVPDNRQAAGLEPVVGSPEPVLDGISDLLEDLQDPERPDEAEGNEAVVIPLAPESAETLETTYERQRREELSVLAGLSARLKFEPSSAERSSQVQTVLDRIFDPLFLYADTSIEVIVNSNDLASPADNRRLSRQRGRVIVDYLAQRGLDTSRFVVVSEGGRGLAIGAHRVQIISEVLP